MSATPQRQEQQKILLIPLYDLSITNHRITKKYYTPLGTARGYKNAKQTNITITQYGEKNMFWPPRIRWLKSSINSRI